MLPIDNVYQFSGSDNFTIGMWIYCEDLNSGAGGDVDGTVFLNTGQDGSPGHLEIRFGAESNGEMYVRLDNYGVSAGGSEPNNWDPIINITANEWAHISFTKSGNLITLYLNGVYNGDITWGDDAAGASASPYNWYLGWNEFEAPDDYYDGKMDDFMVWDYALNASEIQASMSFTLSGDEDGLVGYWNFNEGSGDVVYDQSGNDNDGSINGAEYSADTPDLLDVELGEFDLLVNGESNVLALSYRDPMELTFVYESESNDTIQMEVYRDMNFNGYLDDDDVNLYDHVTWFTEVLDQYSELLTFADNAGSNDLGPGDQNLADGVISAKCRSRG